MGLFDKLKSLVSDDKKETGAIEIIAPLSGEIVNIEDVPDVVFAEKIVGDGIAIKPTGNKMVAPVDGTIGKIFETNHAFSIESDSGIELFVHFGLLAGLDFVHLDGEGDGLAHINVGIVDFLLKVHVVLIVDGSARVGGGQVAQCAGGAGDEVVAQVQTRSSGLAANNF